MTFNRHPALLASAPLDSGRATPLESLTQTWGTLTRWFRKKNRQRHSFPRPTLALEILEGRVTPAITITSLTNSLTNAATGGFGGSSGQNTLTITGTDLNTETINYVLFTNNADSSNTYQVSPGTATATTLTASYPASMNEGTYTVTVGINTGPVQGSTAMLQILPPTGTISPTSGSLSGGTPVTITGQYLSNASNVFFGTAAAQGFNSAANTDTTIKVSSPSASAGSVTVSVQFPGSSTQYSVGTFTYAQPEFTLTGFYPNFASSAGQPVNVLGANLSASTVSGVEIWNQAKTAIVANADLSQVTYASDGSSLTFQVPSGLTADTAYNIAVVASNGSGNAFAIPPGNSSFSYANTSVVPGTIAYNTNLTDATNSLTVSQLISGGNLTVLSTGISPPVATSSSRRRTASPS